MATNIPQDDFQKTALRLPKDLHARVHEAAAEGGRSYNAEIVARLQGSFEVRASPAMVADLARAEAAVESYKRIEAISSATTAALAQYVVTLHERLAPKVRDELNTAIAYRLALALLQKDGAGLADIFSDLFADDLEVVREMHRLKGEFDRREVEVAVRGKREVINLPDIDVNGPEFAELPLRKQLALAKGKGKPKLKGAPVNKVINVGNIGRDTGVRYLADGRQHPANKPPTSQGPAKRTRNRPPK